MNRTTDHGPRTTKALSSLWLAARGTILVLTLGSWLVARCPVLAHGAERIVSLNACTDELLLQLAEPGQIAGVTRFELSPKSKELLIQSPQIVRLPSDIESLMKAKPSIVLAGPFSSAALVEQLKKFGVTVAMVQVPRNWDELIEVSTQIAGLTNAPGKLEDFRKSIQELKQTGQSSKWHGKTVVFWSAAGHVSGSGTFEDTILSTLGMKNGARFEGYAFLSLEKLIQLHPDVIVVTQKAGRKDSWAHETLFHPALKKALPEMEYLHIPEEAVSCASGYTIEVLRNLLMGSVPSLARD